jgi:hypothetical protein
MSGLFEGKNLVVAVKVGGVRREKIPVKRTVRKTPQIISQRLLRRILI